MTEQQLSIKYKAEKEILRYKKLLEEDNSLSVTPITEKQYNYEFDVLRGNEKIKVLVYFGKKGVRKVIQGNNDSQLFKLINEIITGDISLFDDAAFSLPEKYIGSDESGKGDFFGPLSVAAFYADKNITTELMKLGVRDSKALTDNQIISIANTLKSNFAEYFNIFTLEPEEYNIKYEEFGNNLNKLLIYAHSKAVKPLLNKFDAKLVITDKFSNRALTIENEIEFSLVKFVQETKAEKYPAVAAASILARSEVVYWFEQINMKLKQTDNISLPKGASPQVDEVAKILANKYSKKRLQAICKTHFKNFSKIS
jgi:ribonuclease HIII